jgi:hypothetical protein
MNYNRGYACANGIFVAAEGLDMFKLGAVATGGRPSHQATCPLRKELWLVGCLGVEPRSVGIALADGLCDLGGIILVEGLNDWVRQAVPLLNHTLIFALQLRKSTDNLNQALLCVVRICVCLCLFSGHYFRLYAVI